MKFFRKIQKLASSLSIIILLSLYIAPLQAAMVDNRDLIQQAQHEVSVNQVISYFDQTEVQQQLIDMGVDPIAAKERVYNMSDAELAQLNRNLEELPAGSGVIGILLVVFIVLVITDLLGATDIFPFVKNINK
jgi:hypothetical protein